jgi:hypothetical protein
MAASDSVDGQRSHAWRPETSARLNARTTPSARFSPHGWSESE